MPEDDSAAQRILHVALVRFGTDGYAASSVRSLAAEAGVSPGLILHHFGSKEGLREACDEHVFGFFRTMLAHAETHRPAESMEFFGDFDDDTMALLRYLMRQASEDSPRANAFVAGVVRMTQAALTAQAEQGYVRPTDDPAMTAAVLVMMRMGPLLVAGALQEATGADVRTRDGMRRMYRTTVDMLSSGIYTEAAAAPHSSLLDTYDAVHPEEPPGDR